MSSTLVTLPKVLLMGLCKSGKSSIQKVVFEGMQPHECVNLPTTVQPNKSKVSSRDFMVFEVWDFPGQTDVFRNGSTPLDSGALLNDCGAIVFVMDCRELIEESCARLSEVVCAAFRHNPELCVEVFIHKVDALTEEQQTHLLATLQRDVGMEVKQLLDNPPVLCLNFNLTTIYDHSVFQAFSLVMQRLIRLQSPYITELLQMLNSNSNVDLSYLFLSKSKIFLALDERNRVMSRAYDLCSDAISVMDKMSRLYTFHTEEKVENGHESGAVVPGSGNGHGAVGVGEAIDTGANILITLSNRDCIYVKELPMSLTVVMMAKNESFKNRTLIDYNISVFSKAVLEIFAASACRM